MKFQTWRINFRVEFCSLESQKSWNAIRGIIDLDLMRLYFFYFIPQSNSSLDFYFYLLFFVSNFNSITVSILTLYQTLFFLIKSSFVFMIYCFIRLSIASTVSNWFHNIVFLRFDYLLWSVGMTGRELKEQILQSVALIHLFSLSNELDNHLS